ncbi:MAG: hypothetical protein IPK66_06165 [Rhodospirillales bacterium]|nr:hypothetical protein [Rhodospirillales bacterium]
MNEAVSPAAFLSGDDLRIEKLRAALRAYRAFTRGRSRSSLTWLELSGDIEAYTNVAMGAEVLRQFVEGVSKKDPARTRIPSEQNLEAIVAFLTHPEIDALSRKELKEDDFAWQACVRLSQFLRQEFDAEPVRPPPSLEGTYRAVTATDGATFATLLRLQLRPEDGTVLVRESADLYEDEAHGRHKAHREAVGWSVLTPEDSLLFFLKDLPYGRNHYWVLAAEADLWSDTPPGRLILLRHDYPPELGESGWQVNDLRAAIAARMAASIHVFERV